MTARYTANQHLVASLIAAALAVAPWAALSAVLYLLRF